MILKISARSFRGTQGHVLVMVLVVVVICAIALMSYLQLVNAQNRSVARSQGWNAAVPVTEAGVEEALAHLNANVDNGLNVDGWTKVGNYYRMERSVGDSYYVVTISITNALLPIIESRGFCHMPLLVQNQNSPFFLAMPQGYTSPRSGYVGRGVRISAKKNGSYNKGVLTKDTISISGNVLIDSYNSCDPAKSTAGRYDSSKAGDGGDIASNGKLVNEINANGSVQIKGHISTGPGGTVGMSGNAAAGSQNWIAGGNRGIQTGWFRDDMNANIADVPAAPTGGFTAFPTTGGTFNGVTYDVIVNSGTYNIPASYSMSGQKKMLINGPVQIYFQNGLSMSGQARIDIGPSGSLQMWGDGSVSFSGQGLINQTGDPTRFYYFGTKNNSSISLSGGSDFVGIINAPYATLNVSGGAVIHGATVAKKLSASGGFTLHYDQCLGGSGNARFIVTSWDEMTPQEVAQVP